MKSKGGAKQFGHSSYIENFEAEGDGDIEFIYSPSNGNSNGPPYEAYGQGPSSIAFDNGCGEFLHIESMKSDAARVLNSDEGINPSCLNSCPELKGERHPLS